MSSRSERTRTAILDAAWKRLLRPGDPARLEDIAADAAVTRQSVYLHFGNRGALLVALVAHIDETLGLPAKLAAIDPCADPVEALEASLRLTAAYQGEIHGAAMALARLAPSDPDAAAALDDRMRQRRAGLEALVRAIRRQGRLRAGWTAPKVADALWEAGAPSSYHHLVIERGWAPAEFERWLLHLARSFLARR